MHFRVVITTSLYGRKDTYCLSPFLNGTYYLSIINSKEPMDRCGSLGSEITDLRSNKAVVQQCSRVVLQLG